MKRNIKKIFNEEFERVVPKLSGDVYATPISVAGSYSFESKVKRHKRVSFFVRTAATVLVFIVASSMLLISGRSKTSQVTCYIVYFSSCVQIVERDNAVISIDALGESVEPLVKNLRDGIGNSVGKSLIQVIDAAFEMGYINASDTICVKVINNSSNESLNRIAMINGSIKQQVQDEYKVRISTKIIGYEEYNIIVFNGNFAVDNLDEDIELIMKVDGE